MKRSSLHALTLAAPLALAWAVPGEAAGAAPAAPSASAVGAAASAVKHPRAQRKKAVVRKTHAAGRGALPVVKLTPAPGPAAPTRSAPLTSLPVPPPTPGVAPSVIGPSTAASAGGPGFAVIANPVGAAASAAPRTDAGAPTDPRMR